MREASILLVEGSGSGTNSLEPALQKEGYKVSVASTGTQALALVTESPPDLVIFDASFMRSSGVRTCLRLRRFLGDTPIIHSRAASQPEARQAEADVYLVRPFTARKVINRIRALLPANALEEEIIRAGDLTFYRSKRSVDVSGQGERRLTPKLALLLEEFLRHPNETLNREHLMQNVWNTNYLGDTRTLDVHIRWVRELIEKNPAKPKLLKTVRGVGYIFCIPAKKKY